MTTMSTVKETEKKTCLAERLAIYAENLHFEDIPAECILEAKRRIIDSLGCAMGAIDSNPATIARNLGKMVSTNEKGGTIIGTAHQTTPDLATFANGILFRYLDFNDTYLSLEPAHPSDNIAAVLAVGETLKSTGKEILTAIVLAYEIQCRMCDAVSIRARGWDHVTFGPFSVALAVGKLYGFTRQQYIHALGLAGTPNHAVRQTRVGELSNWKGCAFANAARNGVFATMLAKSGMTGPSEIFEGEMGFFAQVSGEFELAAMGAEKGTDNADDFMIMRTYIKHFPAEYHSQSAIEAALELRPDTGGWENIEEINIDTFDAAVEIIAGFKEHWRPKSRETADHSMPYVTSAAFMDGDITLDTFTDERINDPKLVELIQTVKIHRAEDMNAGYPEGIPNRLRVKLKDGRELTKTISFPLGHAKNLMNNEQIEAKFRPLAERIFDSAQVSKQLEKLWAFDSTTDVADVLSTFNRE